MTTKINPFPTTRSENDGWHPETHSYPTPAIRFNDGVLEQLWVKESRGEISYTHWELVPGQGED